MYISWLMRAEVYIEMCISRLMRSEVYIRREVYKLAYDL